MYFLLLLGVTALSLLSPTAGADSLQEKLSAIVSQSGISKSHLGLYAETADGQKLFDLNGSKKYVPASITKIITSAAVLNAFQPDHQFKTLILYDGTLGSDGVLEGNLYLKGGGDPAFVSEKMWMLVNDFLRANIKKVSGNIIVDDSWLDDEKFDKGREAERNDRAYDAPLSGLSFNWNSTTIYVRPGERKGAKAEVWVDPENEYIILENKVTTAEKSTDLQAERTYHDGHETVTVSGKIAMGSTERHIYKNVSEPAYYAGYNLKAFLNQRGVTVSGKVLRGSVSQSSKLAAEVASQRLYEIVNGMDKFSNNFIAEMLAKDLAQELTQKQGTMDVAVKKIREFLAQDVGLAPDDFSLVNVSGFTRKNQFSARQFVRVLSWVRGQFSIAPEFIQSLPVAGVDGTLEKRFKDGSGARKVRAKTGLLNGVVALSGFASREKGRDACFAFIFNGNENEAHVRETFDKLAAALTR